MSPTADPEGVASPCISVCVIDPVSGLCGGCFRTLDEIASWIDFSSSKKRDVIASLSERRSSFGDAIEARMGQGAQQGHAREGAIDG